MRRLRIPDETAALVRGMHPVLKRRVRLALEAILTDPSSGKELKEELNGLRSYRVGRLRIVYRIAPHRLLEIVAIGPRTTIYEDTLVLLQRNR